MERARATCLVALYGIVDALDQSDSAPRRHACGGPPAQRSDSAGRCLGLAAQRRRGSSYPVHDKGENIGGGICWIS